MDKNRHHKKNSNWKNQNQKNSEKTNDRNYEKNNERNHEAKKIFQFNQAAYENPDAEKKRIDGIIELKSKENICPICNQNINDLPSAIADKATGVPAHFECVLKKVSEGEQIGENEKIAYIGQGRFGLLYFENPRDQRKFTIKKIIEYEDKEKENLWRSDISELYSKIN